MTQGRFKGKGQEILGSQKPSSLDEFLHSSDKPEMTEDRDNGKPQNRQNGKPVALNPDCSESRSFRDEGGENRETETMTDSAQRTVREEFRCPPELSDRLNTYVFEQKKIKRRTSKTEVVNEALDMFLTGKGY